MIAVARIVLIVFGFVLACLGFKRTLEPLIAVPMGIGMMAVNCGMMSLLPEPSAICCWTRLSPMLRGHCGCHAGFNFPANL